MLQNYLAACLLSFQDLIHCESLGSTPKSALCWDFGFAASLTVWHSGFGVDDYLFIYIY